MRRILLTGSTGLLGTHLVELLDAKFEVYRWSGDLVAGFDTSRLPAKLDAVVHLAQSRRFRDFPAAAGEVARVNTLAAVDLAEHAVRAGASHLIYASTGGVYRSSAEPLDERAPIADHVEMSFYAATKYAAERLLAPFASRLHIVIVRPFFIYGGGQDRSMLIPRLIDAVRNDQPIKLSGEQGMRINPVHALDAAFAVRAALQLETSDTINIAGPEVVSIRQLGELIGRSVGRPPAFEVVPDEAPGDLVGDTRRMCELLHVPRRTLSAQLGELVD